MSLNFMNNSLLFDELCVLYEVDNKKERKLLLAKFDRITK